MDYLSTTTSRRRSPASQLLLGLLLVCINSNLLLGAGIQRVTNSRQPRRSRRLHYRAPLRALPHLEVGIRSAICSGVRPNSGPSPAPTVAVVPTITPQRFEASGLIGCDPDFARGIAFPPRYLVFCSFLC